MIIPARDPAPATRIRPSTVTTAFGLQLGVVAVLLVLAVGMAVEAVVYDGLIDEAARLTDADPDEVAMERAFNVEWVVITGLPVLALLGLYAGTAFPVRSGSNVARILTCVATGLPAVFCVACGGLGALVAIPLLAWDDPGATEEDFWSEESPFYEKLYELQATGLSSVLTDVGMLLIMTAFAASIAVAVLLLVPPSNRYYRPPAPLHAPPVYPFAYPVPPGYILVPASSAPWMPPPVPPPASDEPETPPQAQTGQD